MQYSQTSISGLWVIEPQVLGDERGYFFESYRSAELANTIGAFSVVQENQSRSRRGVLRGLHLQLGAYAQAKLVRCVEGAVLDVAVDLRQGSPTFAQHFALELSADNHKQLFIPRGFAHGFLTLSEYATLQYKVDNSYSPEHECSLRYDDEALAIDWLSSGLRASDLILSPKDEQGLSLEEYRGIHLDKTK